MRTRLFLTLLVTVLAVACTDKGLFQPDDDEGRTSESPSFAIVDAGNDGGVPGFWFLPPLAKQVTTEGTFDPNFEPGMEVCELTHNPHLYPELAVCTENIAAEFDPGTAEVGGASYAFSWKTRKNDKNLDSELFYRINIFLMGPPLPGESQETKKVLGYLDVNPQSPSGETPGEDFPDLYAFRKGETLPVKFFLNHCATADEFVTQCAASAVVDDAGGIVTLDSGGTEGWSTLSVILPAGALPDGYSDVTLTIERIDPALFLEVVTVA